MKVAESPSLKVNPFILKFCFMVKKNMHEGKKTGKQCHACNYFKIFCIKISENCNHIFIFLDIRLPPYVKDLG